MESLKLNVKSEKMLFIYLIINLFINALFNNDVSGSGYTASHGRMTRQ